MHNQLDLLDVIRHHIRHTQKLTARLDVPTMEVEVPKWQYLVRRVPHWRSQLFIRGRNLPVGTVVAIWQGSCLSDADIAHDLDLPLAAVQEVSDYMAYNVHRDMVRFENLLERLLVERYGDYVF